ncbi:P-loop containing nucleoside triphosphate hydrolase protein [Auricularia subglabra TFB-10046 SS5]|nr:P-loop containing nucleoside triphosphate hydrolase protein [Auricularia subglabra TFB-10046 SS5]
MGPNEVDHEQPTPTDTTKRRIGRYDEYYDAYDLMEAHDKLSKYALVVRRIIDDRGRYEATAIDIKSPPLRDVLREINENVRGVDLSGTSPQMTELALFHSYQGLCDRLQEELSHDTQNSELIADITTAIRLVKDDQARQLDDIATLTATGVVAWSCLLLLFKPNTILYAYNTEVQQDRLVILRQAGMTITPEHRHYVTLNCEILHHDGYQFGCATTNFDIEQYKGARRITDLDIYPLDFHVDKDSILASAIETGKKLASIPNHWLREYDGLALRERERSCLFAMRHLREVVWNDSAFGSLVIESRQKTLIHALVQQHSQNSGRFDDIIKGKGKGLIGLLAGPPGCGKTLTAEAVAEITHKPLYQVTAGELGVNQETIEAKLLGVLRLAEMWGAVLLLDEAEVFLQQRTPDQLQRNAIVSIFLRQIEYYQGILILTTNLVHECDHAFESRIHFSVRYRDLNFDARLSIWRMFFQRSGLNVDEAEVTRLAGRQINGRQIKNAFSSAQTISLSRGFSQLQVEDIDVVLDVLRDWEDAKPKNVARLAASSHCSNEVPES